MAVHPPGRSQQPGAAPVTMWIDLASPEHCDAGTASLTTIGMAAPCGAMGERRAPACSALGDYFGRAGAVRPQVPSAGAA
jgi:hypothetical protein